MALNRSFAVAIVLTSSVWPSFWLATQFHGGSAVVGHEPRESRASPMPASRHEAYGRLALAAVVAVSRATVEAVTQPALALADGRATTLTTPRAFPALAVLILTYLTFQAVSGHPSSDYVPTVGCWRCHGQDRPHIRGPPLLGVGASRRGRLRKKHPPVVRTPAHFDLSVS